MSIRAIRSDTEHLPCAVILLDHHPADSRTDIAEDQTAIQTLTSRMGTGGGNVPMILEPITFDGQQVTSPLHKDNTEGGVCHTLSSDSRNYVVIPLEGNGARPSHRRDGYRKEGPMYSLNTTEVHGVAYSTQLCGDRDNPSVSVLEEKAFCIPANPMSDRGQSVAYAFEPGILKREGKENRVCEEISPTIREHMGDNQTAVAYTLKIRGGL